MPRRPLRLLAGLTAGVLPMFALAACTSSSDTGADAAGGSSDESSVSSGGSNQQTTEKADPFAVDMSLPAKAREVAVDTPVRVTAAVGELENVVVRAGAKKLPGKLAADGASWTLTGDLEPGKTYKVQATGVNDDGSSRSVRESFRTDDLTLDEQTYPSVAPLDGETVGVGMPVVVTFDLPVANRKAIEKNLSVASKPAVKGTWHWMSDTEVHYRPKTFWPVGADVDVDVDINSVDAGNGIYGQEDRKISFDVGDSVISTVNIATFQMKVEVNGRTARTIPITTGKPGFETRNGTKVIVEKFESKTMDAATTGIQPGDAEYYNISNVQYAMRVTYTGEFLHAAPWSVGSQGYANVSHGCVGMSTEDAAWLFSISQRGDVVHNVGGNRPLEKGNGYTDWDMSWAEYKKGSALS